MPIHHPDDSLLLEYAAGSLGEAKALLVATHLALCPACRSAVRSGEAAGAALAFGGDHDETMAEEVPDVALEPVDMSAGTPVRVGAIVPEPLRGYLGAPVSDLAWQAAGLGVKAFRLPAFAGPTSVRLLAIPPGRRLPRHTHEGEELTLVLQGSFADATGTYRMGDVATADQRIDHQPRAGADVACLCLAVEDAPLRLTGLIGRVLAAAAFVRGVVRR